MPIWPPPRISILVLITRLKKVHAMGPREGHRHTVLGVEARQVIEYYFGRFRGEGPGPLFLTCRGGQLCRTAPRTIFQRLGQKASLHHVHPHRFRHTFATWAIEQQAREIDVQTLFGRSTPAMLQRYTATYDAEKAAQAHVLFSPADRLKGRLAEGSPISGKARLA